MSNRIFEKIKVNILPILTVITIYAFLIQNNAQTVSNKWYVDKNANGSNDGTSWSNAWTTFSKINWSTIQPGDTVFISGGIISKTYNEELKINKSGSTDNHIIITKSSLVGHNGEVIVDRQGNGSCGVDFGTSKFVNIEKISIKNATSSNIYLRTSNCVVSNCRLYISSGATCGIDIRGSNNVIEYNISNTSSSANDGQRDFVQCTSGGDHIFRYNNIRIENTDVNDHCDGLQFYSPFTDRMTMRIYGNTIWQDNTKTNNAQGIYIEGVTAGAMDNTTWYIYDNLLIAPYAKSMIALRNNNAKAEIYNNTIYQGNGVANAGFWIQDDFNTSIDNVIIKNNIFYSLSSSVEPINIVEEMGTGCAVSNNLIYSPMNNPIRYLGEGLSLSTWNAYSFVGSDIVADPEFTIASANNFTLQPTSPANNAGVNLGESFNKDILGNTRPSSGAWTIGAYEYTDGNTSNDKIPPSLSSIALVNSTTLELNFSEELETISAQTISNYNVNNGIAIKSASLSPDKKKVTLTTTQHFANQNYIVTVTGVKDLAGNIISLNNSAQYTFADNTTGNLKANVKVFLEGPFRGSSMSTALPDNGVMPDVQPYSSAPWNYNGSESFNAVPDLTVDWVLVELRSAENPAQVVSTRAGLLRSDGRIMEPDGTPGVTFKNILYGSYYIAVRHRNHLAVMSSSPVLFSPDNDLYDFTTSISKAYGQDGMIQDTSSGAFMMYSGDGNGNGIIDGDDYDGVWSEDNGNIGYLNGDFNLDSGVNSKDSREFWNNGKSTKAP